MGREKRFIIPVILVSLVLCQGNEKNEGLSPVLKSVIVPGWGEKSLNQATRSRIFSLTETALWICVGGSYLAASYEEDNFRSFAAEHAGVDVSGKDRNFWVDIGNYSSREDYNEEHLRFRDNDDLYPETSEWNWSWDNENNRSRFESMRIRKDKYKKAATFLIGGVVVNHIASAIDAAYLGRLEMENTTLSVAPVYNFDTDNIELSVSLHF